jgi:hypothetical protein
MFKLSVNQLSIAPSEAWKLDLVEIYQLIDSQKSNEIDTSIMLNYQRIQNGADKLWLQNL